MYDGCQKCSLNTLCCGSLLFYLRLWERELLDLEAAVEVPTSQQETQTSPSCHLSGARGWVRCDSGMLFLQVNSLTQSQHQVMESATMSLPPLGTWVPETTRHHPNFCFPTFLLGSVAHASLFGKDYCFYVFIYWYYVPKKGPCYAN